MIEYFKRKIEEEIRHYLTNDSEQILVIDGARQVGKTSTIEKIGKEYYKNFISINFNEDKNKEQMFKNVGSINEFYVILSSHENAINKLNNNEPVLVFLDEIQEYPQFLTLLKFLRKDNKYKYICSGSLLGVNLLKTSSIPIGSMKIIHMYPMNFEEYLWANGFGPEQINELRKYFENKKNLPDGLHKIYLNHFSKYLLIGGMPQAVKKYLLTKNIQEVRDVHKMIHTLYGDDASKYDFENKLKIKRIYELIPSSLENTKKRIVYNNIEANDKATFKNYLDEFDYLSSSGIAIPVWAISNPVFPLIKSLRKNLVKFYLSDVGIMSYLYFNYSVVPFLDKQESVNMGIIYECAVANELRSRGYKLNYYDNKQKGEVDFLIDDFETLSVVPIEVKSGKNYYVHSALNNLITCKDYDVKHAIVFSNEREIKVKNNITYLPIYFVMFLDSKNILKKTSKIFD